MEILHKVSYWQFFCRFATKAHTLWQKKLFSQIGLKNGSWFKKLNDNMNLSSFDFHKASNFPPKMEFEQSVKLLYFSLSGNPSLSRASWMRARLTCHRSTLLATYFIHSKKKEKGKPFGAAPFFYWWYSCERFPISLSRLIRLKIDGWPAAAQTLGSPCQMQQDQKRSSATRCIKELHRWLKMVTISNLGSKSFL